MQIDTASDAPIRHAAQEGTGRFAEELARGRTLKEDHLRNAKRLARGDRHVVILLATYNGEACLPDQLYSFRAQIHADWSLIVSDDGSTDGSGDLIRCFARAERRREVQLIDGPRQGFAANFLHLLAQIDSDAPFAAFSDQDDSWLPGKLDTALAALEGVPVGVPAVYCGRTWICSPTLRKLRPSPRFRHRPSFRNAIVQSIGGGNTMMLNRAAVTLLQRAAAGLDGNVASHDWWAYQVVAGAGGEIIYDTDPQVLYRQHPGNVIGANHSLRGTFVRLKMLLEGRFGRWNEINLRALSAAAHMLTPASRETLRTFAAMRADPLHRRLVRAWRAGIFHQTRFGNAGLWLAVLLKRL